MIVREGNNKYEIVMKNGKPFLRMWHPIYDWEGGYHDCMIYKAKTDAPYIKYMSGYLGTIDLDEEMKSELRKVLKA